MTFNINIGQTIVVDAAPEDASGNPGLLASSSVPTWAASPTSGISITPASDGMSAQISGTIPGSYTITVSGQAPSAATISSSFNVVISEQPATQFVFSLG